MGHTNHRRGDTKVSGRRAASGCAGEGANGARGRTDWKRLSHRAARRNARQGNDGSRIPKMPRRGNRNRVSPVLRNPPIREEDE